MLSLLEADLKKLAREIQKGDAGSNAGADSSLEDFM